MHLWFSEVVVAGQQLPIHIVFEVPIGAGDYVLRFDTGTDPAGIVDVALDLPTFDDAGATPD